MIYIVNHSRPHFQAAMRLPCVRQRQGLTVTQRTRRKPLAGGIEVAGLEVSRRSQWWLECVDGGSVPWLGNAG